MYILATQDVTLILLLQPYQQNVHYRNTQHSLKVSEYLLEHNKRLKPDSFKFTCLQFIIAICRVGNLIRESEVVPLLADTLENSMMYIITILLGISVGASTDAEILLSKEALIIIVLGLFAFVIGTASGVLMGKLMYKLTGGKVNPLIGSAGVSAVPMAARVSQVEGIKANPNNYLLMHAMGPNVAGVIGSAIAAGILISFFG